MQNAPVGENGTPAQPRELTSVAVAVAGLARAGNFALEQNLGLSLGQFRILAMLRVKPLIASELAMHLAVQPATVTSLVDRLVEMGLVERQSDASDRRRVVHVLTPEGRKTTKACEDVVERMLEGVASRLPQERGAPLLDALREWGAAFARLAYERETAP